MMHGSEPAEPLRWHLHLPVPLQLGPPSANFFKIAMHTPDTTTSAGIPTGSIACFVQIWGS